MRTEEHRRKGHTAQGWSHITKQLCEGQGGLKHACFPQSAVVGCVYCCIGLRAHRYIGFCVLKALCFVIQLFPVSLLSSCREINAPVN